MTDEDIGEVTVVVLTGWDTKPVEAATCGLEQEVVEVGKKYLVVSTDRRGGGGRGDRAGCNSVCSLAGWLDAGCLWLWLVSSGSTFSFEEGKHGGDGYGAGEGGDSPLSKIIYHKQE